MGAVVNALTSPVLVIASRGMIVTGGWAEFIILGKPRPLAVRPDKLLAFRRASWLCHSYRAVCSSNTELPKPLTVSGMPTSLSDVGQKRLSLITIPPPAGASRRDRPVRTGLPNTTSYGRGRLLTIPGSQESSQSHACLRAITPPDLSLLFIEDCSGLRSMEILCLSFRSSVFEFRRGETCS